MLQKKAEDLLADYIEIKSPNDLHAIVDDLRRNFIEKGLLRQVDGECSIDQIQRGKPFPDDLITMRFATIPGETIYTLVCETHHGSGGAFRRGL